MQTQINCPQCHTPFVAEVHQIIDAGRQPQLKQALLAGQINVAICPRCGAGGQLTTPLLFHDPDHEMFIVHVPMELNLGNVEREKIIGELARQAMNETPQEQRRAYMLQPTTILSFQSFIEKVLETEGITPEMLARQRKQAELLRTLMQTKDKEVVDHLLQERAGEIDETFLAMLRQTIEMANNSGSQDELINLVNLQARLYRETDAGRRLEKRQSILHGFTREAKAEGLSPALLARYVIDNRDDEATVNALVNSGQAALTYPFFQALTEESERLQAAGEAGDATTVAGIRDRLYKAYQAMQAESQRLLEGANEKLEALLNADDVAAAVQSDLELYDEAFMYLLGARQAQAQEQGRREEVERLAKIREAIEEAAVAQLPPEVALVSDLMEAESEEAMAALLDENADLITPALVQLLELVGEQVLSGGEPELDGRLASIQKMVSARL